MAAGALGHAACLAGRNQSISCKLLPPLVVVEREEGTGLREGARPGPGEELGESG